ncbi:hypothetical protein F511_28227 [Dorcoceras hygrometricum]|uniref:EF-hand domain-containing protein n=1 Tax=Dorcoceras hygrometricum TaxID=472368 RepID=A0A2Z7C415_9LAMI|nr:hypothetical protein F511_28227 [Dorcoceras hygrometricum]
MQWPRRSMNPLVFLAQLSIFLLLFTSDSIMSDWNGSKRDHVYNFLRSQGFTSSYDTAHQYAGADAHKYQLTRASLNEDDAFAFLKGDSPGDYITYSGFCDALRKLNLIGECNGLSSDEIKELWTQADTDGNGVLDHKEFKAREDTSLDKQEEVVNEMEQTIGFKVKNAVLFPTEVEKGIWPEDYSLSDHARLTVVFSPVKMPCSRLMGVSRKVWVGDIHQRAFSSLY